MISELRVGIAGGTNATIDPYTPSSPQERYIATLDTARIELLSLKIANVVRGRLGPLAKSEVEAVAKVKSIEENGSRGMSCADFEERIAARYLATHAHKFMEIIPAFFSDTEATRFIRSALESIKADLCATFSKPQAFIERGMEWSLSDSAGNPKGFLAAFNSIPHSIKKLTSDDVPRGYGIRLKLAKEEEKIALALVEQCDGVQLLPQTFTMKSLEQ